MKRHLAAAALLLLSGCASLSPRFTPELAASLAHDEMRKLETPSVELYYPAVNRQGAIRTLTRLEKCLAQLEKLPVGHQKPPKALIYLTTAEYNNAYVLPSVLGYEQYMLLPVHTSLELFNWFELGLTDIGDVSCHEAVHYVQLQQTEGFWWLINAIGGQVYSPNASMETWFLEGLATYYEGRLGEDVGRSHNPIWRAMFLSGIASRGVELRPGDLNVTNRDMLPFGGNYLTGMHFVEYLANKYGEERLWQLIDVQANSIFSPVFFSLRFNEVYGKQLDALVAEYHDVLKAELKDRARPPEQKVLDPEMGYLARIASSRSDGALASLSAGRDEVVTLKVYERDGAARFTRAITPLFPGRPYITADPSQVSGLSFSPDGRWVYVVTADIGENGQDFARLLQFDARTGDLSRHWDLGHAMGGAASPDGKGYLFISLTGQNANLARLDLATGQQEELTHLVETSIGSPEYSPDGQRIAFARRTDSGFDLWLREADGTLVPLTHDDKFDYFPHWLDDQHLLFLREVDDGRMQAHVIDRMDGRMTLLTNAPFTAFDPVPAGNDRVAFLNREGWGWTLDVAPMPAVALTAAPQPPPSKLQEEPAPDVAQGQAVAQAETQPPQGSETRLPPGVTDSPYSPTDHLFWPTLHVPWLLPSLGITTDDRILLGVTFGVSLQGSDRLGLHTWALNASYDTLDRAPSLSAAYGNFQLAPWYFEAAVSRDVLRNTTELQGSLSVSRSFWTTPVRFGIDALQHTELRSDGTQLAVALTGPSISASYFAGESTAYAGTRSGIGLSAAAAWYPKALGSEFNMFDLSGQLLAYVPLPGLKRQTLRLEVRGHMLPGAPEGLLQVGGVPRGVLTGTWMSRRGAPGPDIVLPGGVSFVEPLRGYEDHAVHATNAAIAGARYRYPFIIDRGFASIFYVFPSLFFRQVELEAFGEGAYTDAAAPWHRAAGAAVNVRTVIGSVLPVTLFYQYAQRFDDGLGGFHYFGMAFE